MTERKRKLRAPRPTIHINANSIEKATRKSSSSCMIADSIKAQVKNAFAVSVDLQTIRWSDKALGYRYTYLTPRIAQDALVRFDRGIKEIPAFSFTLRGGHTSSMTHREGTKGHVRHKLGKRRLIPTKRDDRVGTIPEQIGGKPAARERNAPHAHNRRQFGLRAFTLDDVIPLNHPATVKQD
jgi:hypothetical protein